MAEDLRVSGELEVAKVNQVIDKSTGRFLLNDLTSRRFGRLVVEGIDHRDSRQRVWWYCICDCGKTTTKRGDYLVSRDHLSCGCWAREIHRETRQRTQTTHGMSDTPTGNSWMAMMERCFNRNGKDYPRYGAKGRTVCQFLKQSPLNLLSLIGARPPQKTLDRTNNKGSYTCGSCPECVSKDWPMNIRWATILEQARNK